MCVLSFWGLLIAGLWYGLGARTGGLGNGASRMVASVRQTHPSPTQSCASDFQRRWFHGTRSTTHLHVTDEMLRQFLHPRSDRAHSDLENSKLSELRCNSIVDGSVTTVGGA